MSSKVTAKSVLLDPVFKKNPIGLLILGIYSACSYYQDGTFLRDVHRRDVCGGLLNTVS